MSFKKNKYTVIRQAIPKDLAAFIANYFSMKKQVYDTCRQTRFIVVDISQLNLSLCLLRTSPFL